MISRVCRTFPSLARVAIALPATIAACWSPTLAFAQDAAETAADTAATTPVALTDLGSMEYVFWGVAFVASLVALVQAVLFYKSMMQADEGTPKMIEIAGYVREGAAAYLRQQYIVVAIFFAVICALLAFASYYLHVQNEYVPFAFLTGGFFSGLAGFFGMKTATWASSRTAAGAQKSLNAGLQVAFRSGAVMGLTVVGLGLLDITVWYAILRWGVELPLVDITVVMLCFGMGASSQALFARVGGGIFTKAADVGADLVGKVEQGIPEDDPRNPATIADNVGDNVGDVAGMGADLYESYCGSILATAALGVAAFAGVLSTDNGMAVESGQLRALFLPMMIAGVGIFLSILGIYLVRTDEDSSQKALLKALGRGIDISTILVIIASVGLTYFLLPSFLGISGSVIIGLAAGWVIGKWTEYCTSDEYQPTKNLAAQTLTGPATVIIAGVADGMKSVWVPVIVVCLATLGSFALASSQNFLDFDNYARGLYEVEYFALGLYGVGIAAVGMLSTLGITLATDAYGPIADNAGGNAEMAGLEPIVRERTDALDSLGNTTAATGKGFAIGSAALTALALLAAYIEEVRLGFEYWANDAAVVREDQDPGFYKVTDQLVVQIGPKVKEGETRERLAWLVFPEDSRKFGWSARRTPEMNTSKGVIKLDIPEAEEYAARIPLQLPSNEKATATDVSNFITLVSAQKATLPDYARYYDASLLNPKVLVGVFIGCMATFVFCAMTMQAVGRAAQGMVEEVRRQFRENPGIMKGTSKPDYARPVAISTKAAQREMVLPSLLGLVTPIAVGLLLGVGGVLGLLVGTLCCGFCVAIFMANAGGSWDNAKKYVESGAHGGKGTDAHKAAVVGDTVGDPFKDTSGPSLNILIKLMSMVSVVAAGLIVRYSLAAMGLF
ncbi:sodium-translocating pyrophosphatase [Lignipirellula cremea]|uniref:Putative K(+)-stimulated pyrophosphate-energized sodium pump n=2 Tax=Lignipirellula cremea TaxID=2528010 RepID=A0A518E0X0_9BACT|nr:sodium-translocating pyrophosphatase [Lignipirellula cremea]QDU97737.1 Putative K(+)-stimulated pyrophosphate-energized sodium pump [Lignipirellula cremea]